MKLVSSGPGSSLSYTRSPERRSTIRHDTDGASQRPGSTTYAVSSGVSFRCRRGVNSGCRLTRDAAPLRRPGRPPRPCDVTPMAAVKGVSAGDLIACALRSIRIATLCLEPANCCRHPRPAQPRQPGRRQFAEHAVREPPQIRLELRRARAVHDRLPEQVLLRRGARGRRRCRLYPRRGGRPQRRHGRVVQIARGPPAPRLLPAANRRPGPRAEQPVSAARVETAGLESLLDLPPCGSVETQPFLDHRTVAAPHPNHASRPAAQRPPVQTPTC